MSEIRENSEDSRNMDDSKSKEGIRNRVAGKIRIGTRGSALALAQTKLVIAELQKKAPGIECETVVIRTKGDKLLDRPLIDFGGKGAFVTEFENLLHSGEIDLAVHSAKDMPAELGEGLVIAGVLPREDARDVLVTLKDVKLSELEKPLLGTGSLRRQFQCGRLYPNAEFIPIRGNVPTRLQKLKDKACDGVILAAAGLKRLGLFEEADYAYRCFSYEEVVPSGGQGIIAIEGRAQDAISELVKQISDMAAEAELETERKVLQLLGAGCHEAIGVISQASSGQISLRVIREQEGQVTQSDGTAAIEQRSRLAQELVERMHR